MADNWIWLAVGVKACPDCLSRHGNSMPIEEWEMIGVPGDGATICMDYCQCLLMREGFLEEIAGDLHLEYTNTEELLSVMGFAIPIQPMTRGIQTMLMGSPDLAPLGFADMAVDEARAELIDMIRVAGGDYAHLEVRGLYELIELYESIGG